MQMEAKWGRDFGLIWTTVRTINVYVGDSGAVIDVSQGVAVYYDIVSGTEVCLFSFSSAEKQASPLILT